MRYEKVIHPEVALNRRGDSVKRESLSICLSCVTKNPNGGFRFSTSHLPQVVESAVNSALTRNQAFFVNVQMCRMFKEEKERNVYYVPKDFVSALSGLKRGIPAEVLPDRFFGYFLLGGDTRDSSDEIEGGYIFIGSGKEFGYIGETNEKHRLTTITQYYNEEEETEYIKKYIDTKVCAICYISKDYEVTNSIVFEIDSGKDIAEVVGADRAFETDQCGIHSDVSKATQGAQNAVYRAILNAAVYANSEDPEILDTRPTHNLSHSKRKAYLKDVPMDNRTSFPIQLLNWNYHKPTIYNVDSAFVDTHMRWQRCGIGLTKTKLVWVKEHERHYNNDKPNR